MKKSLRVGVDEFTVVCRSPSPVYAADWYIVAGEIIDEFLQKSKIEVLFGKVVPAESAKLAGYTHRWTIENVPWYFAIGAHEHHQEMGICVRFSAEAWAWYQKKYREQFNSPMNVAIFIQMIQSGNYIARISRIDLTADYFNYGRKFTPDTLYNHLIKKQVIVVDHNDREAKRRKSHRGEEGIVETVYIGSKKENSKSLCRIYDKKLEQIEKSGFRLDEALTCDNWTRFEVSYRGDYAHQVGEELLAIKSEMELSQFIAAKITDKYRFLNVSIEDYTEYTNDLLDIAKNSSFSFLRSENPKNNTLAESISHLMKGSGLYSTLYKVGSIWGEDAETELLGFLYHTYRENYVPEAYTDRNLDAWLRANYNSLKQQKLSDSFFTHGTGTSKGDGDHAEN
ncbi:MAG: replication initiation factor domain-containing protein [Acutalibacter sp.]|nr:replication initiation factor domain-containing protein [Acutalibacter sp.]